MQPFWVSWRTHDVIFFVSVRFSSTVPNTVFSFGFIVRYYLKPFPVYASIAAGIASQMPYLKKENHVVNHGRRGILSLAGRQTHFNGPEFVVSLRPNPWMNGKYVAFGLVCNDENKSNHMVLQTPHKWPK